GGVGDGPVQREKPDQIDHPIELEPQMGPALQDLDHRKAPYFLPSFFHLFTVGPGGGFPLPGLAIVSYPAPLRKRIKYSKIKGSPALPRLRARRAACQNRSAPPGCRRGQFDDT